MERLVGLSINELQTIYGDRRALEIARECGADAVDFTLTSCKCNDYREQDSVYAQGDEAVREYYADLKRYADSLGLIIGQTHGKLHGFRNIREEDDALVENTRLDCIATAALGAPVCVVHNATSIYFGPTPDPALMHRLSFDMFSRIVPYAAAEGIKIATETFGDAVKFNACDFFGNIEEFEKAYAAVKAVEALRDHITICVDTGHSNKAMRYGNPKPADVIRRLGKDVTVLHLNDNDTLTDQHKTPMTGNIDWNDVFNALDEIGYHGIYNMELRLAHFGRGFEVETAAFAVKVMRYLLNQRYGA